MTIFNFYNNKQATDIVLEGWTTQQQYSNTTFNTSLNFLDNIVSIASNIGDIPSANTALDPLTATISPFEKPADPTQQAIEANFPTFNADVSLTGVSLMQMPDEPTLTAVEPVFENILPPATFNGIAPIKPDITDHSYPDSPTEALPAVPSLLDLMLPTAPSLIDVQFTASLPGAIDAPKEATFNFIDSNYASELLTAIQSKLQALIAGMSTGLSPEVEQQIWDRSRRRQAITARRLKAQNERYAASAGWDLPGGYLLQKNYEAEQEAVNLDVTESRSVAIAQADLEQKNFQFALTTAVQIEIILIQHFDAQQQRALDAAKYAVEAARILYGLKVSELNAHIEGYKAEAVVGAARIQAELGKVELYKGQLEGQKLIGELNQQSISLHREQINSVVALFELYKSKLEAIKTRLQGDQIKLQGFESEIKAFEATIRAKSLEYDQLKILNDAQLTKAEFYKASVAGFTGRVDSFKSVVDARKTVQDAEIELNQRIPLEVFKQKSDAIKTLVQAEAERINALAKSNETSANIFETKTKAETARIEGEASAMEQEVKYLTAKSTANIEALKAQISAYLAQKDMLIEAAKAGAQVAAQLAAASLSAVNLSASTTDSNSTSTGTSSSTSNSVTRIING